MPNNLIAVNAGSKLTELKSFADLYDFKGLLLGAATPLYFSVGMLWQNNCCV